MRQELKLLEQYMDYVKTNSINNKRYFALTVKNMLEKNRVLLQMIEKDFFVTFFVTIFDKEDINSIELKETNQLVLKRDENFYLDIGYNIKHIHLVKAHYYEEKEGRMEIDNYYVIKSFNMHDMKFLQVMYRLTDNKDIKRIINSLRKKISIY